MEPIVIYLEDKDEIKLTKKQFEKYIKDAYKQGYDNGYAEGRKTYWYPWTNTGSITTSPYPNEIRYGTTTPEAPNHTQITCNTNRTFAPGGGATADPDLFLRGDDAIEKVTATNGIDNTVFKAVCEAFKELGEGK